MKLYKNTYNYRFGFQGQEKDDEIFNVTGTSYTAQFWQYDPRLGRRWNVDPMTANYAWQSPYAAFNNNPVYFTDPLGLKGGKPRPRRTKKWYAFWRGNKHHSRVKANKRVRRRVEYKRSPKYRADKNPPDNGTNSSDGRPVSTNIINYSLSLGYINWLSMQQTIGATLVSRIDFKGSMVGYNDPDFFNEGFFSYQLNGGVVNNTSNNERRLITIPLTGLNIASWYTHVPSMGNKSKANFPIMYRYKVTTTATTKQWKTVPVLQRPSPRTDPYRVDRVRGNRNKMLGRHPWYIGEIDKCWLCGGRPPWYGGHIFPTSIERMYEKRNE